MSAPAKVSRGGQTAIKQVRGDQLVAKVLAATLEELALVGYEQLSFEHVADRADVHKVTLYRRWASKRDLARDAIAAAVAALETTPSAETRDLRSDLVAALGLVRDLADSPTTRAIMRLVAAGSPEDELVRICAAVKSTQEEHMKSICRRAIALGELPPVEDLDLIQSLLVGVVLKTHLFEHARCSDAELEYVVDLVLAGIRGMPRSPVRGRARGARSKRGPEAG